jgi:hypothetical protein
MGHKLLTFGRTFGRWLLCGIAHRVPIDNARLHQTGAEPAYSGEFCNDFHCFSNIAQKPTMALLRGAGFRYVKT